MSQERYQRQFGIIAYEDVKDVPIRIVGAGGIGSMATLMLAKMGCESLTVYDFDTVEDHNLPNQMYPEKDIGRPKVEALQELVKYLTGIDIEARNEKFEGNAIVPDGILISAVDSMAVRSEIFQVVKDSELDLFVDGRMGSWVWDLFAIRPQEDEDMEYYEGTLFPDGEALQIPCTERAVSFNTGNIGSEIAKTVAQHVNGMDLTRHISRCLKLNVMLGVE